MKYYRTNRLLSPFFMYGFLPFMPKLFKFLDNNIRIKILRTPNRRWVALEAIRNI